MPDALPVIEPLPGPGGRPGVLLHCPPNRALDDEIRASFDADLRHWWPERGGWWIAARRAPLLETVVLRHWPEIQVLGGSNEPDVLIARDGSRTEQRRIV